LELHGFRAFERFRLRLKGDAYLAGPNNAGKSTLIAALRASAQMIRIAMRRGPSETFTDGGAEVLGYSFSNAQVALQDENLRHEGRALEARIVLAVSGGGTLRAVWPLEDSESEPFFYLQRDKLSVNNVRQARDAFPEIGVVPVLSPLDPDETVLTPKYVRENLDGRLASRHFRNQLSLLRDADQLDSFRAFAAPWISEMHIKALSEHLGDKDMVLDLYYTDQGRRSEKEISWAGDGMQIWLQLLLHVYRLRENPVILLDEPDVFLHPDLQRRLVRLLESLPGQTITATHSSEVLVEASPEPVLWVDKTRKTSVSSPDPGNAAELSSALGSHFNIRLARALRARCVLFVEGDDAKILRELAATIGALRVAAETGIAVIPLRGFDNWEHVEPFSWMSEDLLDGSVQVFVLLDRDFRPDTQCADIRKRLKALSVECHVWKRKELESYLLETPVIARATSATEAWLEEALAEAADELEDDVFAQILRETAKEFRRDQQTQAAKEGKARFTALWQDRSGRKWVAPAEGVLHGLNRRLAAAGHKTTSFRALARRFHEAEVPPEMVRFLDRVEGALDDAGVPREVS
jgi:hypothetical protein